MALQGKLDKLNELNDYFVDFNKAYLKIEDLMINPIKKKVRVHVRGYADEYSRHNNGLGIFKQVYYIPLEIFKDVLCTDDNMLSKAYEYISKYDKTLKELKHHKTKYKGSIDNRSIDEIEDYEKAPNYTDLTEAIEDI